MTQQMCLTFLTLNLIGSNFSRVTDTESSVKIKYTKYFGLFDAFLLGAIPYGVSFISCFLLYKIINRVQKITMKIHQLLILIGLVILALSMIF